MNNKQYIYSASDGPRDAKPHKIELGQRFNTRTTSVLPDKERILVKVGVLFALVSLENGSTQIGPYSSLKEVAAGMNNIAGCQYIPLIKKPNYNGGDPAWTEVRA